MDLRERTTAAPRHPWELARADHILRLLKRAQLPHGARVLDAGSGDSFVAAAVQQANPGIVVTCWDLHYSDADLQAAPPGTVRTREEPEGAYDAVLALDVIEHVPDDVAFLQTLRSHATPDATLIVTVPAYQRLFSAHDRYLGHYRRYSRHQLVTSLESAGWTPVHLGGFFLTLLPPRAAAVAAEKRRGQVDDADVQHLGTWSGGKTVTRAIRAALAADAALGRAAASVLPRGLPGLSIGAIAHPHASA